jgi:hypothetical protein
MRAAGRRFRHAFPGSLSRGRALDGGADRLVGQAGASVESEQRKAVMKGGCRHQPVVDSPARDHRGGQLSNHGALDV